MEIQEQIAQLTADIQAFQAKRVEEIRALGAADTETNAAIKELITRLDEMEVKAARPANDSGAPTLSEELKANQDLTKLMGYKKKGSVSFDLSPKFAKQIFEEKTITVAGTGKVSAGVVPVEREPGILGALRPRLRMRDILTSQPTSAAEIYWVSESVRPTKASPVTENEEKLLSDLTLTTGKEPVQTIAICTRASNQILADYAELEAFLRDEFSATVREEEDSQILFGDGVPPNLHSLTHQAQPWDVSILTASDGYEFLDVLEGARQQVAEDNAEIGGPFFVVHPRELHKMRRTKDTVGRYLLGDPMSPFPPNLWGTPILDTTQMTQGSFLYGNADPRAAVIRDRQGLTIELSTEDGDNFRYNRVTIRTELRLALVVKRPLAFCYGAFTQSPA